MNPTAERTAAYELGQIDGAHGVDRALRPRYSDPETREDVRAAYDAGYWNGVRARTTRMVRRRHLQNRRRKARA
jgi:hypothetical protein